MNSVYNKKDLENLWEVLKNTNHGSVCYKGLEETKFNLPDFEEDYTRIITEVLHHKTYDITTNISYAIEKISDGNYIRFHLSCQANTAKDAKENTALSIKYRINEDNWNALVLPGIKPIPTEETLQRHYKIVKEIKEKYH